jgi:hypothetical protein
MGGGTSKCELCDHNATIKYRIIVPIELEEELQNKFLRKYNTFGYYSDGRPNCDIYRCSHHPISEEIYDNPNYDVKLVDQGRTFGIK